MVKGPVQQPLKNTPIKGPAKLKDPPSKRSIGPNTRKAEIEQA